MKKILLTTILCLGVSVECMATIAEIFSYAISDKCPKETPFSDGRTCFGCEANFPMLINSGHEKDFEICSNRKTIKGYSILKKCPIEQPLKTEEGLCLSCDFEGEYKVNKKSDCDVCPRASFHNGKRGGYCSYCPENRPLAKIYEFGRTDCQDCNSKMVGFSKHDCEKCPNRKYIPKYGCTFAQSPNPSKPLVAEAAFGTDGIGSTVDFFSCDELKSLETTKDMCNKCPNRVYKNGVCQLK